jgi:hypothetical protein
MQHTRNGFALAAWLILATSGSLRAADDRWQVGMAPSFSSGKYGTDSTTEVFHTPVTARMLFDAGDITLVFPFTCIRSRGGVTVIGGTPVRNERQANATGTESRTPERTTRPAESAGGSRQGASSVTPTPASPPPSASEAMNCGMGDVIVRGRAYVLDERAWMPTIAIRAHVKGPTASASENLGTGKADAGIGVEISRSLGAGWLAMLDGGYTAIGEPAGMIFNNNWWYDVGVGRTFARNLVNVSVFFEESRALVPGLEHARDILAVIGLSGASGWRLQAAGQFGISEGAADRGLTLGASRRF